MTFAKAKQIEKVFEEMDYDFPDKSTEFLLEITAQAVRARKIYHDCDAGHVAEALATINDSQRR